MSGRVTMLSIARWNGKYSYRTIERFFDMKIDWLTIRGFFYLLVGFIY
jgi:hypothetical protein